MRKALIGFKTLDGGGRFQILVSTIIASLGKVNDHDVNHNFLRSNSLRITWWHPRLSVGTGFQSSILRGDEKVRVDDKDYGKRGDGGKVTQRKVMPKD